MDNARFYEMYVQQPYATQFGVSSSYALPTYTAQQQSACGRCRGASGQVWRCVASGYGDCHIHCYPVREHPCCRR